MWTIITRFCVAGITTGFVKMFDTLYINNDDNDTINTSFLVGFMVGVLGINVYKDLHNLKYKMNIQKF